MSKPRQHSSGLSDTPNSHASSKKQNKSSTRQAIKEQTAIELINQGKLIEAESIYKQLIAEGTRNHIVYSNLAELCGMQGKPEERIKLLESALKLKPNYTVAHNNLGLALQGKGDLDAAITAFRTAIQINPNYIVAHNNLGLALQKIGDLTAAITSYEKALELKHNYPEAQTNLGNALKQQDDLAGAIASYKKAIEIQPNYIVAHNNLGIALKQQGDLNAAIASYKTALELKPDYTVAHNNLGIALKQQGDLTGAIASYKTALELKPDYTVAHINLGNALKEKGDLIAAIASYKTALQLRPDHTEAYYNLGNALEEHGDLTAAITCYKRALKLKPSYTEAHYNLGLSLQKSGDLIQAITSYKTALKLKPGYLDAHNNLGLALQEHGDLDSAIASFETALQLKPNHPEADWNLSLAMLLNGDYKNGWEKYELRTKSKDNIYQTHALPKCTPWPEEVELRTTNQVLLVSEQGLGDTLQFMRYAITLKEQGKLISLCAQPKLHSLIQASGIDASPLTPDQANQITEGHWIPLLSVPRHLEVGPSNPVITDPYIKTTDELHAKWAKILSAEQQPIIGINWQGNPNAEKTTGLRGRSLALESFAPITSNSQISLLSLQKGFGSEQVDSCSFKKRFVSCQDHINETWDFLETAAIIANCDLIITSDTSVAHLAAGMGKPTWLLLKKVPDWRWGLTGDTSFWYPSMRLFRQKEMGNWSEVIERVTKELQNQLNCSSPL